MSTIATRKPGMFSRWFHSRSAIVQDPEATRALATVHASSAATSKADAVALNDVLYPSQVAGVSYVLDHARWSGRAIIGDEMGLGKSLQAISVLETQSAYPAVIVVPASLGSKWKHELTKWVPGRQVAVLTDGASFIAGR